MGSSLVVRSGLGGWWKAPVAGPPDGVRGGLKGVAARAILPESGGMAERFNAPVLKTGVRKDPWVRIPLPPFSSCHKIAYASNPNWIVGHEEGEHGKGKGDDPEILRDARQQPPSPSRRASVSGISSRTSRILSRD